jgi:hypothetical protein
VIRSRIPGSAGAAPAPEIASEIEGPAATPKRVGESPTTGKVSPHLLQARELVLEGMAITAVEERVSTVTWKDGRMEVEVRLESLGPELLEVLKVAGLEVTYSSMRDARVVGTVAPEDLEALAAVVEVSTIHPLYGYVVWTGSVDDQADVSMGAALARSLFGVDGSGVEIGVLSDSFNTTLGGSTGGSGCSRFLTGSGPQTTGDLPASVRLLDNGAGGTDEGAGMAELIHDLAPGSPLAFHTAGISESAFADGIDDLRICGAGVIVDDILFFAEPMFQDGPVAQAAQAAFDAGVPYYSAAGNQATFGVDEIFDDFGIGDGGTFGEDLHDYGGGDRFAAVTIPAGCTVRAFLQWNDPFDGTLGPGASDDLDLYGCLSADPTTCMFGSTGSQGCAFGAGQGEEAMLAAATPGNRHSAGEVLTETTEHPHARADDHWSDDGGTWWDTGTEAPSYR